MQRYYIFFIPANVLYLFTPNRINEGVVIDERKELRVSGALWEICGLSVAFYKRVSIIMLQKSSARKGFVPKNRLRLIVRAHWAR